MGGENAHTCWRRGKQIQKYTRIITVSMETIIIKNNYIVNHCVPLVQS